MNALQRAINRMGLYSRDQFQSAVTEAVKREIDNVYDWMGRTAKEQGYEIPDPIIYANQADLYRLSPLLGTALDVLAGDIGGAKFNVKRLVGEEEVDIPNHPLELLMSAPNPLDTGNHLLQDTTNSYKLNGNAYWWLNRESWSEQPLEMWPIPASMLRPVPDGRLYLSHYDYFPAPGQKPIPFPVWQVVHFKNYNPANRFVGLSPIESLVMTIKGDLGMRKTNMNTYVQYQGAPPSILAFKDSPSSEAKQEIKDEVRASAEKNRMMILYGIENGVSWMQRALSNGDMQFIENMRQNMTDVFNRMCPGLLAMLDPSSTEANALAARATYAEKTLWPMMNIIANRITADVLPAYETRWKLKGEFDDPRVVDRKLELEEQATYERTHTIEEVRKQYYQDKPLGDERDQMFVSEIRTRSAASPFDNGQQQPPQLQQNGQQQPVENQMEQDTNGEDVSMKAAVDDLVKWRRMALNGKANKAQAFKSAYIPARIMQAIKANLGGVDDKDVIARMFDGYIEQLRPKPQVDPAYLIKSIELGVKALGLRQ